MAVGEVHPTNKFKINNPKNIFLLIMMTSNLNDLDIQLKVVFKNHIFINKFN